MAEQVSLDELISNVEADLLTLCNGNDGQKEHVHLFLNLISFTLESKSSELEILKNNEFESMREMVEANLDYKRAAGLYTESQLKKYTQIERLRNEMYCFFHGTNLKKELKNKILENANLAIQNEGMENFYSRLEDCLTGFLKEKKDILEKKDYELVSRIKDYSVEIERAHERLYTTFIKKTEIYTELYTAYYPDKINAEAQK